MNTSRRILTAREHLVYQNRYASIFDNDVIFPNSVNGTYIKFEWHAPYGIGVLPILEDGRLYFVRSFRYATNDFCIEIPKGFGSHALAPEEMASRELLEETGLKSDDVRYVSSLATEPGLMNHTIHLFEAHGSRPWAPHAPEDSEVFASPLIVDVAEALQRIRRKEIIDSLSINAVLLYHSAIFS